MYPTVDDFIRATDRMLMYLGRYAKQDATNLERTTPTATLMAWVDRTHELLKQEDEATNRSMRR